MRNVKSDVVLIQVAVWIFIYLFTLGNNEQLILKVTEPREKCAAKAAGNAF